MFHFVSMCVAPNLDNTHEQKSLNWCHHIVCNCLWIEILVNKNKSLIKSVVVSIRKTLRIRKVQQRMNYIRHAALAVAATFNCQPILIEDVVSNFLLASSLFPYTSAHLYCNRLKCFSKFSLLTLLFVSPHKKSFIKI